MKRMVYDVSQFNYKYDATRQSNKYYVDSEGRWVNHGEAVEAMLKWAYGLEAKKDPNTGYNEGSDIEKFKTSVKSPKFGLTSATLANTKDEYINKYFETTASKNVAYGYVAGSELIVYWMKMEEFRDYLKEFSYMDKGRLRGNSLSNKMINWFERRIAK